MKLEFITFQHIEEAIKYLVSGKGGKHLPVTDESGTPNHRLMGAAWAALHGGYRGNKYEGPDKAKAISTLKAMYKAEKMDMPMEADFSAGAFFQEALRKDDSFDSIRCKVMDAINANIRAGVDMDADGDGSQDAIEYACAWCQDIFPGAVVYSMNGKLMQCDYSIDADGDVQLGTPSEVEMAYQPVSASASDAGESTRANSRALAVECQGLQESAYDSAQGELTVTVIKPGFSKNKTNGRQRFYPSETLTKAAPIFKGAKMFADHATESEDKARPEGSIRNWVANVTDSWAESDGTVKAKARVIDPPFKAKLDRLKDTNLLNEMGVSVRIAGAWSPAEIDGQEAARIDEIVSARSVDFVTFAGAGGMVEAMESDRADEFDVDLIDEAGFRKRRPDIVELIESNSLGVNEKMKTLETQLQEAHTELAATKQKLEAAETKIKESETAAQKADTQAKLTSLLAESKLPEAAQNRIRTQFKDAIKVDGMKEAIDAEREYIKAFAPTTKVTNLGKGDNGSTSGSTDVRASLVESFMRGGMTKEQAEIAAVGR